MTFVLVWLLRIVGQSLVKTGGFLELVCSENLNPDEVVMKAAKKLYAPLRVEPKKKPAARPTTLPNIANT